MDNVSLVVFFFLRMNVARFILKFILEPVLVIILVPIVVSIPVIIFVVSILVSRLFPSSRSSSLFVSRSFVLEITAYENGILLQSNRFVVKAKSLKRRQQNALSAEMIEFRQDHGIADDK